MKQEYQKYQKELFNFCKTGIYKEIKGTNNNLNYYRKLIYNVFDDSLQSAYPLTYNLLEQEEWDNLVSDFLSFGKSKNPQVWKMPKDLIQFVANNEKELLSKYSYLIDLLKFEWAEVELFMQKSKKMLKGKNNSISLNKDFQILELEYPVHKVNASKIRIEDKGNYFVLIYREMENNKVKFIDLSPSLLLIFELLNSKSLSIDEIVDSYSQYYNIELNDEHKSNIKNFLEWGITNSLFFIN